MRVDGDDRAVGGSDGGVTGVVFGGGEVTSIFTKSPPRRTVGGRREAAKTICRRSASSVAGCEVCLCAEPLRAAKWANPVRRIYKKGRRKEKLEI